jgi:hypothetical protein
MSEALIEQAQEETERGRGIAQNPRAKIAQALSALG